MSCDVLCVVCGCRLQERPEDIPTGELPRTLLMVADRHLVGRVTPGSRLVVTGIYCTHRWGPGHSSHGHAQHLAAAVHGPSSSRMHTCTSL